VLTLQNHVSLSPLNIGFLKAGSLKGRAWGTLRAVVQGVAPTRAVAHMRNATPVPSGAPRCSEPSAEGIAPIAPAPGPTPEVDHHMPRIMPRGVERC
jgi:hypothetical protein